jgi:hypothetical protein
MRRGQPAVSGAGNISFQELARSQATVVRTIHGPSDGSSDLPTFRNEVDLELRALESSTGYEYRATFGQKADVDVNGNSITLYSAVIHTSSSPIVVAPVRGSLVPSGYSYLPGEDIHNHGHFFVGSRMSRLDVLYFRERGFHGVSVGDRVTRVSQMEQLNSYIDKNAPSIQDRRGANGGWLSTPGGLVRF